MNPADRPNPEEQAVPWRDIGDLDTSLSFLYPDSREEECPVPKNDYLEKEHQQAYMQWIEKTLDLDRRTCKDPRLYCRYCDINNHPRFAGKHTFRHQKPNERHRCTLCTGRHPLFLCQVNGGSGKPNWHKIEYTRAKQESREPDFRWGEEAAPVQPDFPTLSSQIPSEDQQLQCAAAAMMHGSSRGASSSWQGGGPPIAEHQEWYPPLPQQHVILPNPGYKIEANLWHLDVKESARRPRPIASFLRHCNTMDSPYIPSYARGGPQPADDIVYLTRDASMENLRGLQSHSEKLGWRRHKNSVIFTYTTCTRQTEHQSQEWSVKMSLWSSSVLPTQRSCHKSLVDFCACSLGLRHLQSVGSE